MRRRLEMRVLTPLPEGHFSVINFFHLCRNKSQNPGLQLAQGVYQEVLSKTEVLHLRPAYK